MCLWAEARGEIAVGRLAIMWVIANRALAKGISAAAVILHPLQFSSFNLTDANRHKMLTAWQDDPAGWGAVDGICELFEAGFTRDPTNGADHYYNPETVQPSWGRGNHFWNETAVIGRHVFGKCP
jgi:spore germination cell wall hydrolase CwlJ-like protein